MRVNVYDEEIDENSPPEIIRKVSTNGEVFFGLRVWLKSCQELIDHSTPEDDDRSAVTFWTRDTSKLRRWIEIVREIAVPE